MTTTSRYWTIQVIDSPLLVNNKPKGGYKAKLIVSAQEFFMIHFPNLASLTTLSPEQSKHIQVSLWKLFHSVSDIRDRALAGLCLRCYVSQIILTTCKKIPLICQPKAEMAFSYIDLLPFVLNDDGRELIILDSESQTQLILNHDDTTRSIVKEGELFSVDILQKFNPNLDSSESLDNWIWRLTQQNQNLKSFLWEFGVRTSSNWALLCKNIPHSLEQHLQKGDRRIIEVFHAVYRRDRQNSDKKGRCSEPTPNQLQEMRDLLQQTNITLSSLGELMFHFKRIAEVLQQDTLSKKIGGPKTIPLEVYNEYTKKYICTIRLDYHEPDIEEIELEQIKNNFHALFKQILYESVAKAIKEHIEYLSKSKGYKSFAQRFPEGLQLYYQENKTLGEIAQLWEISWYKVRRIFVLEDFMNKVQARTEENFLETIVKTSTVFMSTTINQSPDFLKNVAESIKDYALKKTFNDAYAEILNGKRYRKKSLFAQMIRRYLNNFFNHLA
ncbi:MAG: hypothetical protein PUP93_28325 [Rhizonema sp. NSF051]|nr:hypothetical protein [Rhizonema sp. NSF051]